MAGNPADVDASCAICGAPPYPECPHEGERLALALKQAEERWTGVQDIRDWVLNHARNQIILTFQELRNVRHQHLIAHLQALPYYTLWRTCHGNPPVPPAQLMELQQQMAVAQRIFKAGVDEDWRNSCMRYPDVLDYYFSLVELRFPSDKDPAVVEPRFGAGGMPPRKLKERRSSNDWDSAGAGSSRKKEHRSRRRTPPPPAMPPPPHGGYPRR